MGLIKIFKSLHNNIFTQLDNEFTKYIRKYKRTDSLLFISGFYTNAVGIHKLCIPIYADRCQRPFDGSDPTYTTEDFLNAITANMVMRSGSKQIASPFHEAWIFKRIAMIPAALIGPTQQWYSHLPLDIKKNWQAFSREFQKTFDNQQSQTQAKLLLESITRSSVEQIRTLALRIEQMTRKAYVKNAPDMRNAQINEALVKAHDPQLARMALKRLQITNQLHWNHNFHLHNMLKKYIKKIL